MFEVRGCPEQKIEDTIPIKGVRVNEGEGGSVGLHCLPQLEVV